MELRAEPIAWIIRLYEEPGDEDRRDPYVTVMTALTPGNRAILLGMHGEMNREARGLISDWLQENGYVEAEMERRGRWVTKRAAPDPAVKSDGQPVDEPDRQVDDGVEHAQRE